MNQRFIWELHAQKTLGHTYRNRLEAMRSTHLPEREHNGFTALQVSNVALLTTFRRNGQGVQTPVGIRFAEGKVYFTTWSTTGKVKRLARNPRVTLAPFTKMGMKVVGEAVEGTARRLEEVEVKSVSHARLHLAHLSTLLFPLPFSPLPERMGCCTASCAGQLSRDAGTEPYSWLL